MVFTMTTEERQKREKLVADRDTIVEWWATCFQADNCSDDKMKEIEASCDCARRRLVEFDELQGETS